MIHVNPPATATTLGLNQGPGNRYISTEKFPILTGSHHWLHEAARDLSFVTGRKIVFVIIHEDTLLQDSGCFRILE